MTEQNFEEIILGSEIPVVIDFWAPWCGPCKALGPVIEELAEQYKDEVLILKCDVEENDDFVSKLGIRNVPTLLFFEGGIMEPKSRLVGNTPKADIVKVIETLITK